MSRCGHRFADRKILRGARTRCESRADRRRGHSVAALRNLTVLHRFAAGPKRHPESLYFVMVPDTLKSVSFIEKDSKRFPHTHGWAYAQFRYEAGIDSFEPNVTGAERGYACHAAVAAKHYIFTAYPKR
jgi:Cytochrome P460